MSDHGKRSSSNQFLSLDQVWLRYFGKPVNIVKVFCQNPNVITKYAKAMAKIPGVTESLEEDIRYSTRYLIDNNVSPRNWHEIEVEEEKYTGGIQVDNLYTAKSPPKISERPPDYFYAKSKKESLIAYRICRPEDCFEQGILGAGGSLVGEREKGDVTSIVNLAGPAFIFLIYVGAFKAV